MPCPPRPPVRFPLSDGARSGGSVYPLRFCVGTLKWTDQLYADGRIYSPRPVARGVYYYFATCQIESPDNKSAQISWNKALSVFDSRISGTTLEQGTKLRRWKEVVEEVHLDFWAKIPDEEPPILTERAYKLDGRTEESRYPNLMLPWVRRRYGI